MIIDVDSHWEITRFSPHDDPLGPWAARLPRGADRLAFGIAGDLLRALPAERRPGAEQLLPGLVNLANERGGPVILHPQHDSTAAERVAWMDRVGIDHCLVNPGGYWQMLEFVGDDRPAGVRRCNDYLTDQLSDRSDRLHAVAIVDFTDLDAAVVELERARARGARAFFLYTASDFQGWANIGWDEPRGAGVGGLVRLANTQRTHAAQNLLSALLYGGVFARHPAVTVLLEEMRVNWVPPFLSMLEQQSLASPVLGDWPWEMSGGDMLRRHVRITPLPGFGDVDALAVAAQLPGMVVFSSDYPHLEGNGEPLELYQPELDSLDEKLRSLFLGDSMAECFARTGDPLPSTS
jgi:predicted TIM-barrel fold metal-dependent hydrolase